MNALKTSSFEENRIILRDHADSTKKDWRDLDNKLTDATPYKLWMQLDHGLGQTERYDWIKGKTRSKKLKALCVEANEALRVWLIALDEYKQHINAEPAPVEPIAVPQVVLQVVGGQGLSWADRRAYKIGGRLLSKSESKLRSV